MNINDLDPKTDKNSRSRTYLKLMIPLDQSLYSGSESGVKVYRKELRTNWEVGWNKRREERGTRDLD